MKTRRHHNNKGTRQIQRGKTHDQVKRMAGKLGVPSRDSVISECAACVPTTWLDPLLTGPKAVGKFENCPEIERLLTAVKTRILALSSPKGQDQ